MPRFSFVAWFLAQLGLRILHLSAIGHIGIHHMVKTTFVDSISKKLKLNSFDALYPQHSGVAFVAIPKRLMELDTLASNRP